MPLSKDRDRERKRLAKVRLESAEVRLESEDVQPPFYTGIGPHFGEVRDKEYAKRFFDELFKDRI